MSINFLDITYVIIFSLVHCYTNVVWKSPKFYTSRYVTNPSKITFYIHNPYKAKKYLDYNYQDWEEKKSDIYDYSIPTTIQTSTTASDLIINETSPQEIFYPESPTSPLLESSQYNLLYSSSPSYSELPSNESTSVTSLATPSIDSTPLSILPSLSISYNTTTTILTPESSTANITIVTTTPSVIVIDPVSQFIRDEVLEAKDKLRRGFFTASIYVLLKIIERKKSEDVTPLLFGLQGEFSRLNSQNRLAMFGPMANSVFTFIVSKMTTVPVELIQTQAKKGQELLENKRVGFDSDTRAIFDVVDSIYIGEDYIRIVDSLANIQNFPNVSMRENKVAEEAIAAFILLPYTRIEGTSTDELLLMAINNFLEKRRTVDENKVGRRYFRNHVKITTEMTASSENITKFEGKNITKADVRMPFLWPTLYTDPTTINSSETDYTSYVTDPKIMKRLRHKMIIYKERNRKIRSRESKLKTKRGMTSTTTPTTTTTEMPPMHKSKYYIRKYVNKKLYKMKISTPKTTKFPWRYYGEIRTKIFEY